MPRHLVITIHLHDDRYHGVAEWPPAPARVFQALVAGVARANRFADEVTATLEWLEALPPPIIAAPPARRGQSVAMFVPNNDADTLGGDLARVSEIRTKKLVTPWLIEGEPKLLYVWDVGDDDARAEVVGGISERLYQLGRGIDMAWARAEVVSDEAFDQLLDRFPGSVHRPGSGGETVTLSCPTAGSLMSLVQRFEETTRRLRSGAGGIQLFVQPPKPHFRQVKYGGSSTRTVYELRRGSADADRHPWRLSRVVQLVERIRDGAAANLRGALPDHASDVERVIIGRKPATDGVTPIEWRVRIVPLPSVGHKDADLAVRRVLVDVPAGGPIAPGDIEWAFSALRTADPQTGEVDPFILTRCPPDDPMLAHYRGPSRRWRTITPAALPEAVKRRRIDPVRRIAEAKTASERSEEEARATAAVITALRHADVRVKVVHARLQREPFAAKGARAEAFADGTRFAKERLWHVDVEFDTPVKGPLVLGDGRFLGLGVCAPFDRWTDPLCFSIHINGNERPDPLALARAFRRAVMSRVQEELGLSDLPPYVSGHGREGGPARDGTPHVAFQYDSRDRRLLIVPPHLIEKRRPWREEVEHLGVLERALAHMKILRAGSSGIFTLTRVRVEPGDDALFGVAERWVSRTPYTVNRHAKHASAAAVVERDILLECDRRELPRPRVRVSDVRGVRGRGLEASIALEFPKAVSGPLLLGRTRHLGGGLFGIEPGDSL
ncbi:MAG: type I-U CRISPR-associated protein Csb2 [Myxococcota bacterium]|nr:type I-U CRISPR-associated protein Csb2 [Myxococcota bacterium]